MNDKRNCLYVHQNENKSHADNINQIQSVIPLAYTQTQPRTMMINFFDTDITVMTVR